VTVRLGARWFTPLISVRQLSALEAPRDIIHNQIFNVGDTTNNYQVKEIAEIIAEIFKDASLVLEIVVQITAAIVFLSIKLTKRYRDSSATGMREGGAQQMFELFTSIDMSESTFLSRVHSFEAARYLHSAD